MCCAIALLALIGPRAAIFFYWLFDPTRWSVAFSGSFIVPFLGFLFLPWTTLMYVLVWTVGGLTPVSWFLVGFAFVVDLVTWAGGGWRNRYRVQTYYH
jgi:hypothetical protein